MNWLRRLFHKSRAESDLGKEPGPGVIPGYDLDLLDEPDGESFMLALHDKKDDDGLFSVFSDQSGIIFLGAPPQ